MLLWPCSTNFGALVVPEVVKMLHPASGAAKSPSKRAWRATRSQATTRAPGIATGGVSSPSL